MDRLPGKHRRCTCRGCLLCSGFRRGPSAIIGRLCWNSTNDTLGRSPNRCLHEAPNCAIRPEFTRDIDVIFDVADPSIAKWRFIISPFHSVNWQRFEKLISDRWRFPLFLLLFLLLLLLFSFKRLLLWLFYLIGNVVVASALLQTKVYWLRARLYRLTRRKCWI